MPLVAVVAAAIVVGEPITPLLIIGGALVLAGVYLGAFNATPRRPLPELFHRTPVPMQPKPTGRPLYHPAPRVRRAG